MTVQIGSIVFTSVRAILKFVLTAACGTILARRKLLDSNGTRAISQCILNVFLPALIFAKVIQGIDQAEMRQVGVLVITAVLYTLLGLAFGFTVRFLTKIPRGWRYGVLATGAFSNWGDLPLVLVSTIVASAPFNNTTDQAKGLAYVSVYIFVQNTLMFSLNGTWLVGRDFKDQDLNREAHGVVGNIKNLHARLSTLRQRLHRRSSVLSSTSTVFVQPPTGSFEPDTSSNVQQRPSRSDNLRRTLTRTNSGRPLNPGECLGSASGHGSDDTLRPVVSGQLNQGDIHATIEMTEISRLPSSIPLSTTKQQSQAVQSSVSLDDCATDSKRDTRTVFTRLRTSSAVGQFVKILWRFLSPPSVATISAFLIAAIPPLRALFVASTDPKYSGWLAPDSLPPLDFIITLTEFIGNASVPCSLLILGYQLSKLELGRMPVWRGAVVMAILKLIVQPIIAIAWTQFLASTSLMSGAEDNVLKLVMILPSAVPSATSLLYITQIMAPDGREENVKYISVFLVVQYMILGITLTGTTVYTLKLIT